MQFSLDESLTSNEWVCQGQAVAHLTSSENQLSMMNLMGDLRKAQADLRSANTGEKSAIQEEKIQALNLAKAQLMAFEPQVRTKQELLEQNLISDEEWEITESTYKLHQSNVLMHEAMLETARTGEKREALDRIEAEIARLQDQIRIMRQKQELGQLLAPIDGLITYRLHDNILCNVSKADTVILQIPVSAREVKLIKPGQKITSYCIDLDLWFDSRVFKVGRRAQVINGSFMYVVTSIIQNDQQTLQAGMTGRCKIYCDKISGFKYIQRLWRHYIGSKLM